jgi:hypothetical protein
MLKAYTVMEFILDFRKALAVDNEKLKRFCPYMVSNNMMIYDYILQRDVDIWEQIVFLASGRGRTSLIPLLTSKIPVKEETFKVLKPACKKKDKNTFFEAISAIIAIYKGDTFNFTQYGKGLCMVLGMAGNKENPPINKANQLILLSKGMKLKDYEEFMSGKFDPKERDDYEKLFERIFSNHFRKAMLLHRLTTIPLKDIKYIFALEKSAVADV